MRAIYLPSRLRSALHSRALQRPLQARSHPIRRFNVLSFFNRGGLSTSYGTPSLSSAHSAWIQALNTGRLKDIIQTYTQLTHWISSSSPEDASTSTALPSESEILQMLQIVANHPNPDTNFIRTVLSYTTHALGRPVLQNHYALLAKALVASDDTSQALSTLSEAVRNDIHMDATAWEPIVIRYAQTDDRAGLQMTKQHMHSHDIVPTPRIYRAFLDSAFKGEIGLEVNVKERLEPLELEMQTNSVLETPIILAGLLEGYSRLGMVEEASKWADAIEQKINGRSNWRGPNLEEIEMLEAFVAYQERCFGGTRLSDTLQNLKSRGFLPSSSMISAVLRGKGSNASVASLLALQEEIGVAAGVDAWSILIDNALVQGGLPSALPIYNRAVEARGPSIGICKPVFETRSYNLPDGRTLYDIYQDLLSAETTTAKAPPSSTSDISDLYEDLLLAMAAQRDRLLVPKQLAILVDMRNRSISFDATTTATVLSRLMHSSGSYNAAYNLYSNVRSLGPGLTRTAYMEALQVFTAMRAEKRASTNFPPPRLFFSIIKDMTDAGFPAEAEEFAMLFSRLRHAAVRVRYNELQTAENPNQELLAEVRRAHVLFRLYAAVTPDTNFLNLLMDTYSRIGGFSEAWSIWEEDLLPPKIYDGRSVSIILDTCGHYGAKQEAFAVWKAIKDRERHSPQNQITSKLWETWIECLCRLDLVEEVRRTLLRELGTPGTRSADTPLWRLYATERMVNIAFNFKWRGPGSEIKRAALYGVAKSLFPESDRSAS
ncbi:hypothetical protein FRB90_005590 [Tulasnella sp. 427]|nr:hypothetical protein FRB90_005590 [Tulasnella sp. 427]